MNTTRGQVVTGDDYSDGLPRLRASNAIEKYLWTQDCISSADVVSDRQSAQE